MYGHSSVQLKQFSNSITRKNLLLKKAYTVVPK